MESIDALIAGITDEATKAAVLGVVQQLKEHQDQCTQRFAELWDFVSGLDNRLREQERYASKDSIIIDNPPCDARHEGTFLPQLLVFLNKMYKKTDITISESRLKAYHILPGPVPLQDNLMPSIIVKFVHFSDKAEIYKNCRMLKSMENEINNKNIWMKERLPPLDAFVKKLAENKNLIAVSNNCRV